MKQPCRPLHLSFAMTLVFLANAYILGGDPAAGRDAWLCLPAASALLTPVVLLYARLSSRFPGQDLNGIMRETLGPAAARLFALPYLIYGLLVLGMSLNCFGLFVAGEVLPDTPVLLMESLIAVCAFFLAWSGGGVIGRWAALVLPVTALFILLSLAGSVSVLQPDELLPVAADRERLVRGVWHGLAFPTGEPILLFSLLPGVRGRVRPRHWLLPFLSASLLLSLACMRNTMVLGGALSGAVRYASSYADGVSDYRNFAQHMEVLTSLIPAAAGIMEAAAALSFAAGCAGELTPRLTRKGTLTLCAALGTAAASLFSLPAIRTLRGELWPGISLVMQCAAPLCCLAVPGLRAGRRKICDRRLKRMRT